MLQILKSSRSTVLATVALLALAGCYSSKKPEQNGSIRVSAATAAEITAVTVRVTGSGISTPITANLTLSGGVWTGTISGVPAGTGRTVTAQAFNVGNLVIFQGAATNVTVAQGVTAAVTFTMQDVTPTPGYTNRAPRITSTFAGNLTPAPGETLTVRVSASDPDGDALSYAWSATGGTFTPASANVWQLQWTAPVGGGTQTLTVRVTDARGLYTETTLTFAITIPGAMALNVGVNSWPVVTAMTAVPTSVSNGQPVTLTAVASDADGDALTISWATTCTGSFSATTGTSTVFTPTAVPASNECTVTATADDGRGGTGVGSATVWVGLAAIPLNTYPPPGPLGLVDTQFATTVINGVPAGGQAHVSLPAPSTAGNMILVVVSQNTRAAAASVTDNLGNSTMDGQYLTSTIARAMMNTAYSVQAFWLPICDSGVQSFTIQSAEWQRLMIIAAEFSGVTRVPNPIDQGFTQDNVYAPGDGTTFHAGPTGTTQYAPELVIGVARSVPTVGLSYTAGPGYQLIGGSLSADDADAFGVEWGIANTTGPQTADFVQHLSSTVTTSTHHAFAVTFRGD